MSQNIFFRGIIVYTAKYLAKFSHYSQIPMQINGTIIKELYPTFLQSFICYRHIGLKIVRGNTTAIVTAPTQVVW